MCYCSTSATCVATPSMRATPRFTMAFMFRKQNSCLWAVALLWRLTKPAGKQPPSALTLLTRPEHGLMEPQPEPQPDPQLEAARKIAEALEGGVEEHQCHMRPTLGSVIIPV